jgi:hypothetical protein
LDDPTLDPNLDKEAMLGRHDDAKLDPESNCTFAKGKKLEKKKFVFEIWRLQRWHCVEHRLFCAQRN